MFDEMIDYTDLNKGVIPRFFTQAEKDEQASEREGKPIFVEIEYVEKRIVGDMLSAAVEPVSDEVKNRFATEYARWKTTKQNNFVSGIPLTEWPAIDKLGIASLAASGIQTVEQLASVSESLISQIMNGRTWQNKAVAYLKAAADGSEVLKIASENLRLKEQIVQQNDAIAALTARLDAVENETSERRGPGRPPKAVS